MSCERCGGLMVVEAFCDLMEEQFRTGIEPTRCLNCGNYEDAIVRANRTSVQFQNSFHARKEGQRAESCSVSLDARTRTHGKCHRGLPPRPCPFRPYTATRNCAYR